MKTPVIDWEDASAEFIRAFSLNGYTVPDRDAVDAIIVADIARAQRMAAAGLRHLSAILGANTTDGKRERWRRDALAPVFFGKTSRVTAMRSVHKRLERAHRRLRDNTLHIRMRPQSVRPGGARGRNTGGFLSPRRFQLFPAYASRGAAQRAAIIVHELLHEWLIDHKIGSERVNDEASARRLASRDPEEARRNPENFEQFLLQVWLDEGLEAPSGAQKLDTPLIVSAQQQDQASGLLSDRPVIAPATAGGRRDLLFCALRARADQRMIPTILEYDATPIRRRGGDDPTGVISYAAACCTLPDGTVITAVRGESSRRLKLIAWQVRDETPHRSGDSGNLYGDCHAQPDIVALGGNRMAVLLTGSSGKMKIDLVEYRSDRSFRRVVNAETSGPIDAHGRACLVSPVDPENGGPTQDAPNGILIATAMRTREGRLSLNLWSGDFDTGRISRHGGLVDRPISGRPAIAALTLRGPRRVVTAVRDEETGRMRLTAYDVGDRDRPRRLGDSGLAGPRMSHSPDIVTVTEGTDQQIATALRHSENGRIIVSTWAAPLGDDGFVRHRYSGASATPVIDSSPSLCVRPGTDSAALQSAAIGADGRLAVQRWAAPG